MRRHTLSKLFLLALLCCGFSGLLYADTVIVSNLIHTETGVALAGEVALASNDKGNLLMRHEKSDASGRVEFRDLTPGEWHLTTKIEGYATEHATVQVADEETHHVSLYLKKGKLLNGMISDAEGKPITQAQVSVRPRFRRFSNLDDVPVGNRRRDHGSSRGF